MENVKDLYGFSQYLNVLFVEDELEVNRQTSSFLLNLFQNVDLASNGLEGFEKYKASIEKYGRNYDIVITDIEMPKLNGIELIQKIQQIQNDQKIMVISAHNDSHNMMKLIELGINYFILKPIHYDSILKELTKVCQVLQNERMKEENTKKLTELNKELQFTLQNYDQNVIASRTDKNGYIIYASDALVNISGYTKEELLGSTFRLVRHPQNSLQFYEQMWEEIKSANIWHGEILNRTKDRSEYWVETIIQPEFDENGKITGYYSIQHDITATKIIKKLNHKINDIMDNIDEAIVIFDKDFSVQKGYSKQCLTLFGDQNEFESKTIDMTLYPIDTKEKKLFQRCSENIFSTDDQSKIEMLLTLFPKEITLDDNRIVSAEYKWLEHNYIMGIFTDISNSKQLEQELSNKESNIHKVIAVARDKEDFLELLKDFEHYLVDLYSTEEIEIEKYKIVLKSLHTYKGLLAQYEMNKTVSVIHDLESSIKDILYNYENDNIYNSLPLIDLINVSKIKEIYHDEFAELKDFLGVQFFEESKKAHKNDLVKDLKFKLAQMIDNDVMIDKIVLQNILNIVIHIEDENINHYLTNYNLMIEKLANKLGKKLKGTCVETYGKDIYVPPKYKKFLKSLVHVYKNCIDHGIETPEERLANNKEEEGTILTTVRLEDDYLVLTIKDNGKGIDHLKISEKILEMQLLNEKELNKLSENEINMMIFKSDVSTTEKVSEISGRGVGMPAVLDELTKLDGQLDINTDLGEGTEFIFKLPFEDKQSALHNFKILLDKEEEFFEQSLDLKVEKTEFMDHISNDKEYTYIEIKGDLHIVCAVHYEDSILNYMISSMIDEPIGEEEIELYKSDITNELLNTYAGLAIHQYNLNGYKNMSLGLPKILTREKFQEFIHESCYLKDAVMKTEHGDVMHTFFQLENIHNVSSDINLF